MKAICYIGVFVLALIVILVSCMKRFMKKKKVILVDNDEFYLDRVSKYLSKKLKVDCVMFVDPKDAIREILRDRYDLVITDYAMPLYDGFDFARDIEMLYPNLPIIVYSGRAKDYLETEARNRRLSMENIKIVEKDSNIDSFMSAVEEVIA